MICGSGDIVRGGGWEVGGGRYGYGGVLMVLNVNMQVTNNTSIS